MRRVLLLLAVSALALAPATALADVEPDGLQITTVETSEHPEVAVTVSAPREQVGRDLPAEAFSLTEDGYSRDVNVQAVLAEERQVVLAIDTSGSMGEAPMEAAKDAAAGFVRQLPKDTRAAVVSFSSTPQVVSEMSKDTAGHLEAISQLSAGGGTALYDGIGLGLDQLEPGDGHAVVVLSDGGDTKSSIPLTGIVEKIIGSNATLYVVELQTTDTAQPAILQQLASAGDGRVVSAADPARLAAMYDIVAEELRVHSGLRDNYVLTYRSSVQRPVDVRVLVDHADGTSEVTRRVSMPAPPPLTAGLLSSPWALAAGAALMFTAMALLLATVLWPGQVRSLLATRRGDSARRGHSLPGMATVANRATLVVERNLTKRGWTPSLNASLERAGINLRPGEFVVLSACAAIAAFAAGLLLSGMVLGVLLTTVVTVLSVFGLKFLAQRRRAKFADQLGETLQLLSGSLRAGYSLLQALDSVAREADSPTAEEYRRIVVETRLGRELHDALHAMDERVGTEDFQWVIQAIAIHREVGGDLAEVLDTVAKTIRERNQIRRQVKALAAEGKLSAIILYALPFFVGGFITLTNPGYLSQLFTDPIGWGMLAFTTVLLTAGAFWLRKIVRLVF